MEENNFKLLADEYEKDADQAVEKNRKKLLGIFSIYQLIGDIFDLYAPKIVQLFTAASGGDTPGRMSDDEDLERDDHSERYPL